MIWKEHNWWTLTDDDEDGDDNDDDDNDDDDNDDDDHRWLSS